ncbi:Ppx/GppA family phosphatase [Paracoccus sp. Z330]|uniref:Ppx/GppA family phosphatase n=1 Tax=Paracoccus onchidii TaxID=3017813 RepID=A0ABT4ZCC8_9RHOB|nr:Ppx/GppA family phosphatase [Paracoccus onchidii]MDB6177025.1 Ppx/GppA family phosphatase [Paracoccus onchidii]
MNGVRTTSGKQHEPLGKLFAKLPKRALSRVGVVDVGSNSIRLVVFDGAARSPAYFYNEKVMAGLGAEMAATGKLNPKGVVRGFEALQRFAALAKGMDIEPLTCVATAAVREAEDGPAFRQKVERETGLKLLVIDGEEEARLSAQGVLLGWPDAKGLVCDIGGNSMELAEVANGQVGRRVTSPLGPFRLQQVKGGKEGLRKHIRKIVLDLAEKMGADHDRIYLVGGSWRAIARLDMERSDYPMTVLHEYRMTPKAVEETVEFIAASNLSEIRSKVNISSSRMELVPLATRVLSELVSVFKPKDLAVSSYGIREGLLYEHMSETLRKRDPLIEAARFSERQMARIPGFGRKLHDFLQPVFGDVPPERDRLIRAACLLHDTTWRTHPDYRAEACFDNVTRANMAALSHSERVFLGVSLLHRYKNNRNNSPMARFFALLSEDELRDAEILGKAMRFGAMFAIDDPSDAATLKLRRRDKVLSLQLTRTGRSLMGEVAVSRFKSLCAAMGVEPSIET